MLKIGVKVKKFSASKFNHEYVYNYFLEDNHEEFPDKLDYIISENYIENGVEYIAIIRIE